MLPVRPPKRSTDTFSMGQQIAAIERELASVIDLPTTSPDLRAKLVERMMKLKVRAVTPPDGKH